jgi:hypothetical protein
LRWVCALEIAIERTAVGDIDLGPGTEGLALPFAFYAEHLCYELFIPDVSGLANEILVTTVESVDKECLRFGRIVVS